MKIKKTDIAEKNLFGEIKDSAKTAQAEVELLKTTIKLLVEQAKQFKQSIPNNAPKNLPELKKQNLLIRDSALLTKEWVKSENALTKAKAKADVTSKTYRESVAKLRLEQSRLNKEAKQQVELSNKETSAYRKKGIELANLKRKIKDLIVTQGAESKQVKKLLGDYDKLNSKVRLADKTVGDFGRNVGNYPSKMSGAISSLKNFASSLGLVAGVAGLFRALKSTVTVFSDFEQSNANLSAVLGKTSEGITALTEDAKRLGSVTAFTASEVSALQTEFAKLGFNEQEILAATEATLNLAAATGSELGEAAAIAGATLGGFGLDASETGRVTDVMAKSFSTSALDLEKFKESMKGAAPAAKAVGISVEQTTALLGTLANAGISGSKAGNNLKTSFINLNAAGLTLEQGLEKVANSEDKLGTAANLVGKNAAASFLVLSEGVGVTKELEQGLLNAGGAAKEMADKQLDTLQGAVKLLKSAWEGLVLDFYDGNGALNGLKKTLVFVAKNLKTILYVVGLTTKAFVVYKAAIMGQNLVMKLSALYTKIATNGMRAFNKVSKQNIIGAIAVALLLAYEGFKKYTSGLSDAEKETKKLKEESAKLKKEQDEDTKSLANNTAGFVSLTTQLKLTNKGSKERSRLIDEINDKYGTTLQNLKDENKFQEQLNIAVDKYIANQKTKIALKRNEAEISEQVNLILDTEIKLNALELKIDSQGARADIVGNALLLTEYTSIIDAANLKLDELGAKALGLTTPPPSTVTPPPTSSVSANGKSFTIEELEAELEEIEEIETDHSNKLYDITFRAEQKRLKALAKLKEEQNEELRKQAEEDYKKQLELIKEQEEKEKQALIESYERKEAIIQGFTDKFTEAADKRISKIDEEINAAQKQADFYKQLASEGNITAEQSLAEQNQIIAESEAEKAKIEQRKRNIELVSSVVLAYNNSLSEGNSSADALKDAFLGAATIKTFMSSLPTFFDGTENTGQHGYGVDGRGGFDAILHPNERVMTSVQNDMIGNVSNEDVAKIMFDHRMGNMEMGQNIVITKNDNANLESEMRNVTDAIKNIPQNNIELGRISQTAMMIMQTKRQGNRTTTNRFKVN